jgi:hypothetical protein
MLVLDPSDHAPVIRRLKQWVSQVSDRVLLDQARTDQSDERSPGWGQ